MSACPQCHYPLSDVVTFCVECGFAADDGNPTDPWNGRMIAERFRLVSKLGAGGMGEVYEAIQEPIGRRVALKILSEELSTTPDKWKDLEAQAASQLTHPNTIVVHDFGQDHDGTLFIAMEFLEGESFDQRIKRAGPPTPEWVVKYSARCVILLVKPTRPACPSRLEANIFLTHRQNDPDLVKVLDFGIAKVTHFPMGDTMDWLTQQVDCGTLRILRADS